MEALFFDGNALTHRTDMPTPVPTAEEALVRVTMAGICGTDLALLRGYKHFRGIPGHEFVGVVEQAADPTWIGKRVVGEINIGCGACERCRQGMHNHCAERRVLGLMHKDGAFAEYLSLPLTNLHAVPDQLDDESAVFVEPLAAAVEILEQLHLEPTQRVCVVGDGRLGLLVAQTLALTGAHVIAIGRHPRKLSLLASYGMETHLEASQPAILADVVVEATGNPAGFAAAVQHVRPRGTLVLKSTFGEGVITDLNQVVVNEIQVIGSRCGPFAPAIRLLASGRIKVKPLIEVKYPLRQGVEAFQHAARKGVKKVLLQVAAENHGES